jgi:hypothetical protein
MGVWGFDRIVRLLRLGRNGIKHAVIKQLDDDYIRIDIPGVHSNGHAYLYFPTITWRVWENHPFSVASTMIPVAANTSSQQKISDTKEVVTVECESSSDFDRNSRNSTSLKSKVGLTFLLRVQNGLTRHLQSHSSLPVLIESSYGSPQDLSQHNLVIAIAGGVGITALLPTLRAHPGQRKLFWASRSQSIIHEMQPLLNDIETEVFVENKLNVTDILDRETQDTTQDIVIMVSGPARMTDEVRLVVSQIGRERKGVKLRLLEESFTW